VTGRYSNQLNYHSAVVTSEAYNTEAEMVRAPRVDSALEQPSNQIS